MTIIILYAESILYLADQALQTQLPLYSGLGTATLPFVLKIITTSETIGFYLGLCLLIISFKKKKSKKWRKKQSGIR